MLPTKDFICSLCGFKFSQEKYLTNHFNLCKDIENPDDRLGAKTAIVKLERSGEEDGIEELLEIYNAIKPTSGPVVDIQPTKDFICNLCGFKFSQEKYLTNHFNLCKDIENFNERLGAETATVKHERSDEEYGNQELLKIHNEIKPTLNIKNEEMDFTEYTISGSPSTRPPEKGSSCDYTAVQFKQHKDHTEVRKGENPFHCSVCAESFVRHGDLEVHMRIHTDKRFKCTICDFASSQRGGLSRHMRKHTGEKPFKCTVCDYAFANPAHLKAHMRRHTGETPFKCTICNYASKQEANLTRHLRKHTGEKPFKCTVCDYASSQLNGLTRHMRRHTG